MTDRKKIARDERQRRLVEARRIVKTCVCTWPLDVMRNGDGHADDCPAHTPLFSRTDL